MINYEKALAAFKKYIENYDLENDMIKLKVIHTYEVVALSEYIAKDLNLDKEDFELAKIIGLLHDIGRFEQVKKFGNFRDYETIDHGDFGAEILFKDGLIRNFIADDQYDEIIKKAVTYHNKYKLPEGLNERELLHAKLIRDADKTDNFRVKAVDKLEAIDNITDEQMENSEVTQVIYEDFKKEQLIDGKKRVTPADVWISYIAFIFDFNFSSGLKYIKEKNYINILVNRINFKNEDTKIKMEEIRNLSNDYIERRCK